MNLVLTLIAGAAGAALPASPRRWPRRWRSQAEPDLAGRRRRLRSRPRRLGRRRRSPRAARGDVGGAPIDVLVQPAAGRRKRLLVADLESTIIENEMLDELADFLGLRAHVAEITRRAMNGEIDFAAALAERVALLKGLPARVLDEAAARIRLMPGARALVATMRRRRRRDRAGLGRVHASLPSRVAAELGFDRVVANRLDIAGGRIAGTVRAADRHRRDQARDAAGAGAPNAASRSADARGRRRRQRSADAAAAGLGIAFRAKPAVAAAARWRIDHADLTALLYAQGYRQAEIRRLSRCDSASALVEAQRDKAQIALALDQQQDRFAPGLLRVVDLAG